MEETAKMLNTGVDTVRRMIARKMLAARHACKGALWVIQRADVERAVNHNQFSLELP